MNEHGKIAVRECRLAVGDRIQCDTRLRNNPFAICSRDLAVLLDSFGFQPALAHAGRCGADLVLRFERNTLCFETAMIDADIDVEFGKTGVDMIRSEEHTSELQSLMRISYAVFCLKKKTNTYINDCYTQHQVYMLI